MIIKDKRLPQVRSDLPMISQTKGQIWGLDLIVAGVIFSIGIVILFYYAINFSSQTNDQLGEFVYEGNLASELLLSESEGILSAGKINQTKLDIFDSLDNSSKRDNLGMSHNFYFTIDDLDMGGGRNYVGIINSTDVESLVQITRLTIYNNKPVKFLLYVWR